MAEESTFLNPSRRSYVYENSRGTGNKKRVILIIVGIIILISLIAFAVVATGGKGENEAEVVITPTETIEEPTPTIEEPTPTEAGTPTPTPKASPTPKESSTSTVDKKTSLDRANLKIAVQNGSGVAGAATKASDILKDLGYDVVSSGNADNFEYAETEIQVKSTKKNYLDLLKSDLADDYTIGSATSTYTGTDADAVVIIGKE